MKIHQLKVDPELWPALVAGRITAEIGKYDSKYEVGDVLMLHATLEDSEGYEFPQEPEMRVVSHIVKGGNNAVKDGWCMLCFVKTDAVEMVFNGAV